MLIARASLCQSGQSRNRRTGHSQCPPDLRCSLTVGTAPDGPNPYPSGSVLLALKPSEGRAGSQQPGTVSLISFEAGDDVLAVECTTAIGTWLWGAEHDRVLRQVRAL